VTKKLHTKYAPFSIGVHCFAHHVDLAARTLFANTIFQNNEKLVQKAYVFFNRSPKRLSEFEKLFEVIETKGLRPLQNVATCWVFLLDPLWRILNEYRTLIVKMHSDQKDSLDAKFIMILTFFSYFFLILLFFHSLLTLSFQLLRGFLLVLFCFKGCILMQWFPLHAGCSPTPPGSICASWPLCHPALP
jgi:hypothetical protein